MNPKMATLLYEGFSITTLDSFSEKQINVLYEKINKKETKEAITKTVLQPNKDANDKKTLDDLIKKSNPNMSVELEEKSVSKKQHGLMGAAYSVEKGEKKLKDIPKNYRDKVEGLVDSMSKKQLKDFAKTKTDKLPEKKEVKKLEENIMKLLENHLPPHTTKGELLFAIRRNKR
jgi:hypothetical protein